MIESLFAILAFFGFAVHGDAEDPYAKAPESANPQIIRAIDSNDLKGFDSLEAIEADEWFV